MSVIQSSAFLRRVLFADALSCAGLGVLLLVFTGMLANLFSLPSGLLVQAGVVLLPFAAFVAYVASRARVSRFAVGAVIALNVVWVVESFVLLGMESIEANTLGIAFVVAQALFVAAISVLEYAGLRQSSDVAAA